VTASFNAFGEYVLPMILFPGERLRNIGLSGYPEATYATIPNGWMDTFVKFLKLLLSFAKEKENTFPIILFVDGHSTNMSLPGTQLFCHDNENILYCLLPNATHVLQACDIGLFSPLKSAWQAVVKAWQLEHIGQALSKKSVSRNISANLVQSCKFQKCIPWFPTVWAFSLNFQWHRQN
jgi:hypothetical protein